MNHTDGRLQQWLERGAHHQAHSTRTPPSRAKFTSRCRTGSSTTTLRRLALTLEATAHAARLVSNASRSTHGMHIHDPRGQNKHAFHISPHANTLTSILLNCSQVLSLIFEHRILASELVAEPDRCAARYGQSVSAHGRVHFVRVTRLRGLRARYDALHIQVGRLRGKWAVASTGTPYHLFTQLELYIYQGRC